jgi:hypothetical protein
MPEIVDQSNYTTDTEVTLGDHLGLEYRHAQSFTLSKNIKCSSVAVKQSGTVGSPTGNWTLRIETNSGGLPSGTLVSSGATAVISPPGNGNVGRGKFASPINLVASTIYWLVIQCDNQADSNNWTLSANTTSVYAGGNEAYWYTGGGWNNRTYDLYFAIYRAVGAQITSF